MKIWKAAVPTLLALCATGWAQQSGGGDATIIRSEVRQVLVDTVVTDKKGAYATDMKVGDFKLLEDGKEQTITSVIRQADNGRGSAEYVVLLFDRMSFDDLRQARDAAKIVSKSVIGPRRFIAAATYEGYGSIRVDQAPTRRCARYSVTWPSPTRCCDMSSRWRMVTASSSSVSKSTVMQNGVPISSWRR